MGRLSASVAMTTYNGEKYIIEQLDSLKLQTYDICEVVICDDGSKDDTERIVNEYLRKNNLTGKWQYHRNETNLGPMKNFVHCAKQCSGDIIFYCDQDDIWEQTKVEEMIQVYRDHGDALAVCCGQQYMDKDGNSTSKRGKYIFSGKTKKISFEEQVRTMYSSGLCLSFRRELLEEVEHLVYDKDLTYDISTGLVAAIKGGLYRVEKPLVHRRIHGENASSPTVMISDRINHYQLHINGRKLQLQHLQIILEKYQEALLKRTARLLRKRIESDIRSVNYLEEHDYLHLSLQCLDPNPLINRTIKIGNAILAFSTRKGGK